MQSETTSQKVRLLYKRDTGLDDNTGAIEVYRSKGRWILDVCDERRIELFGYTGILEVPDTEYLYWLEEQVLKAQAHNL